MSSSTAIYYRGSKRCKAEVGAFKRHRKDRIVLNVQKSDPFSWTMCSVTDIDFLHSANTTSLRSIYSATQIQKSDCKAEIFAHQRSDKYFVPQEATICPQRPFLAAFSCLQIKDSCSVTCSIPYKY